MKYGVRQKQKQPKNTSVSLINKTAQTKNEKFSLAVFLFTFISFWNLSINFYQKFILIEQCDTYSRTRLFSIFQIKNQTKKYHKNYIVSYAKKTLEQCHECFRRVTLIAYAKDRRGKDANSMT